MKRKKNKCQPSFSSLFILFFFLLQKYGDDQSHYDLVTLELSFLFLFCVPVRFRDMIYIIFKLLHVMFLKSLLVDDPCAKAGHH